MTAASAERRPRLSRERISGALQPHPSIGEQMDPTDARAHHTVKRIVTIWEMYDGTYDASVYVLGSREGPWAEVNCGTPEDIHAFVDEAIPRT